MEGKAVVWGNSIGIRIPQEARIISNIIEHTKVNIEAEPNKLIITKIDEPRKHVTLKERLKLYPIEGFLQEEEMDWGEPVGDEVW